jgi:hypothetical protein
LHGRGPHAIGTLAAQLRRPATSRQALPDSTLSKELADRCPILAARTAPLLVSVLCWLTLSSGLSANTSASRAFMAPEISLLASAFKSVGVFSEVTCLRSVSRVSSVDLLISSPWLNIRMCMQAPILNRHAEDNPAPGAASSRSRDLCCAASFDDTDSCQRHRSSPT